MEEGGEKNEGGVEFVFGACELGGCAWRVEEGEAEGFEEAREGFGEVGSVFDRNVVGFGGSVFFGRFVGYDVEKLLGEKGETASFRLRAEVSMLVMESSGVEKPTESSGPSFTSS